LQLEGADNKQHLAASRFNNLSNQLANVDTLRRGHFLASSVSGRRLFKPSLTIGLAGTIGRDGLANQVELATYSSTHSGINVADFVPRVR